jgi:hypothetical protein
MAKHQSTVWQATVAIAADDCDSAVAVPLIFQLWGRLWRPCRGNPLSKFFNVECRFSLCAALVFDKGTVPLKFLLMLCVFLLLNPALSNVLLEK